MTTKAITRKQAEEVLAAVKAKHAAYIGDDDSSGPKLVQDWDWVGHTPWAILWEEGPFEWAITYGGGGLDHEIYNAVVDEVGAAKARALATIEPTPDPDGIFTEPVTSWALGLYPA